MVTAVWIQQLRTSGQAHSLLELSNMTPASKDSPLAARQHTMHQRDATQPCQECNVHMPIIILHTAMCLSSNNNIAASQLHNKHHIEHGGMCCHGQLPACWVARELHHQCKASRTLSTEALHDWKTLIILNACVHGRPVAMQGSETKKS